MNGVEKRETLLGGSYFRLHYGADPEKDAAWAAEERKGTPERQWLREMEMDDSVILGEPVHQSFDQRVHVRHGLQIVSGSSYLGGWDAGTSLSSAFVLLQILPGPLVSAQVQAIAEVVTDQPQPMTQLSRRVKELLVRLLPFDWDQVQHWADYSIGTRSGANGFTSQQIAAEIGLFLHKGSNEPTSRIAAVDALLIGMIENERTREQAPRFVVDAMRCPQLAAALGGGYMLAEQKGLKATTGPGRLLSEKPLKNQYADVAEALQYAASRVFTLTRRERQEQADDNQRLGPMGITRQRERGFEIGRYLGLWR